MPKLEDYLPFPIFDDDYENHEESWCPFVVSFGVNFFVSSARSIDKAYEEAHDQVWTGRNGEWARDIGDPRPGHRSRNRTRSRNPAELRLPPETEARARK